jgi:hypothetical protein
VIEAPQAEAVDTEEAAPVTSLPVRPPFGRVVLACTLAWLVPGAGHVLVGQWRRALLFGTLVTALFLGGIVLEGKVYRIVEDEPLSYLAALGASGVGGYYMAVHRLGYGEGDIRAPRHEYGNAFTLLAGLLNLLIVLDAFDWAMMRAQIDEGVEELDPAA